MTGFLVPISSLIRIPLTAVLLAFAFSAFSQTPASVSGSTPATSSFQPAEFDVVSIRPHIDTGNGSHWWRPTPDGYQAYSIWPYQLVFSAYELRYPGQLIGLPQWANEDTYDIDARIDESQIAAFRNLTDREQFALAAPLLRAMLADRFNLKAHHESRVLPVYELVVAKGGFKLKQADEPENLTGMMTNRGLISIHHGPIGARFIVGLANAAGRIVIDKTGLTGWYDIDLKWTTDEDLAAGVSGPSVFTALEEQLGLKLVSTKAPVDVLVVDHIERPSAN
jgi:uncharacterized protein (TIGR03435 family)